MSEDINIDDMVVLAKAARAQMPPQAAFSAEDEAVLARHRDFLSGLRQQVVDGFYETVYSHQPTAEVFHEGERPTREQSLGDWWERTATGDHDDEYFAWMAMVGLVHVVRGVSNPMMLAMANFISGVVESNVISEGMDTDEAEKLTTSISRLMATVGAVITYGFDIAVESALFDIAGMPQALLRRLRDQSVAKSLSQARTDLSR